MMGGSGCLWMEGGILQLIVIGIRLLGITFLRLLSQGLSEFILLVGMAGLLWDLMLFLLKFDCFGILHFFWDLYSSFAVKCWKINPTNVQYFLFFSSYHSSLMRNASQTRSSQYFQDSSWQCHRIIGIPTVNFGIWITLRMLGLLLVVQHLTGFKSIAFCLKNGLRLWFKADPPLISGSPHTKLNILWTAGSGYTLMEGEISQEVGTETLGLDKISQNPSAQYQSEYIPKHGTGGTRCDLTQLFNHHDLHSSFFKDKQDILWEYFNASKTNQIGCFPNDFTTDLLIQ